DARGHRASGRFEVHSGLLAAAIILDLVADALVLLKRAHAGAFDSADMNKSVIAAAVGCNETIALVGVEEFDGSDSHGRFLSRKQVSRPQKRRRSWKRENGRRRPPMRYQIPSQATIASLHMGHMAAKVNHEGPRVDFRAFLNSTPFSVRASL